jgi:hypothetical protein
MNSRVIIAILSALSGIAAGLVGMVSLTRIAGDLLGFPNEPLVLAWTLTAAVDIGAIAGAVMWSTSEAGTRIRRTGVQVNLACSSISAIGVGLDHSVHASTSSVVWPYIAFVIGAFMPLLSTWLVHGLAKMVPPAVEEPAAATEEVVVPEMQRAVPDEPTGGVRPAPASLQKQGSLREAARQEYMRLGRDLLAAGKPLDVIVLADVDRSVGASPGYAKKHYRGWIAELKAEVA